MPSGAEIQQYFSAAWRLMLGREDGLDRLDLSVDGFWNSFFAMLVSVPALAVGWVGMANRIGGAELEGRVAVLFRLASIDMISWVAPFAALALVARPAGIVHRFIPLVVASNWGTALLLWAMAPISVLDLVLPGAVQLTDALSLAAFIAAMVLSWRLTRASLGMGAAVAGAVYAGTFVVSVAVTFLLYAYFGLYVQ